MKIIDIRDLDGYRAALAGAKTAGDELSLQSPPGAASYAGPMYFKAMMEQAAAEFPDAPHRFILDCGDDVTCALIAVRLKMPYVRFSGDDASAAKLADMARQNGCVLVDDGAEIRI